MNNLRVKYTRHPQIGELRILEEDYYYPFELKHHGYNQERFTIGFDQHKTDINLIGITRDAQDTYRYKFGGKEYQDEFDVNLYDFGARNYDPALGRWMNVDPLADHPKQIDVSPYAYTANNPIRFTDPTGMKWKDDKEEKKAKELQESIRQRRDKQQNDIDRIQNKLDNKNLSDKAIARKTRRRDEKKARVEEMNKSIDDITALGDNEDYTFSLVDGGQLNYVVQGEDGVINIQGSSDALHIHEIRHVSLSLKSKEGMQFSNGYLQSTQRYGLIDEIEGYKAQFAYRPGSLPFSVKNIYYFDYKNNNKNMARMVKKIGSLKHNGKAIYEQINKLHLQFQNNGTYKKYGL